mmetsp:Transcript_47437/g.133903  ORF Transcript_47437/g.133903 Transcript_47437/m.133903 type:complete len:233 (+) Transcript_47437:695-1393(+)
MLLVEAERKSHDLQQHGAQGRRMPVELFHGSAEIFRTRCSTFRARPGRRLVAEVHHPPEEGGVVSGQGLRLLRLLPQPSRPGPLDRPHGEGLPQVGLPGDLRRVAQRLGLLGEVAVRPVPVLRGQAAPDGPGGPPPEEGAGGPLGPRDGGGEAAGDAGDDEEAGGLAGGPDCVDEGSPGVLRGVAVPRGDVDHGEGGPAPVGRHRGGPCREAPGRMAEASQPRRGTGAAPEP